MLPAIILSLIIFIPTVNAAIPQYLNINGRLTNSSDFPQSGRFIFNFTLYNAPSSGTTIWSEIQNISVTRGQFNATLGTNTSLAGVNFDQQYWLGIKVGTDLEMTPRLRVTSNAFVFRANITDFINGTVAGNLNFNSYSITSANWVNATNLNASGTINATWISEGTTRFPQAITCSGTDKVSAFNANGQFTCSSDATGAASTSVTWSISGANIYNDTTGTNVGIGTRIPQFKLEINNDTKALNVSNVLFANQTGVAIGSSSIFATGYNFSVTGSGNFTQDVNATRIFQNGVQVLANSSVLNAFNNSYLTTSYNASYDRELGQNTTEQIRIAVNNSNMNFTVTNTTNATINTLNSSWIKAIRFFGSLDCTSITGGSDGDFCSDATSSVTIPPLTWSNNGLIVFNDTTGVVVGIGTKTPIFKLEINNDTQALNVSNFLFVNQTGISTNRFIISPNYSLNILGAINASAISINGTNIPFNSTTLFHAFNSTYDKQVGQNTTQQVRNAVNNTAFNTTTLLTVGNHTLVNTTAVGVNATDGFLIMQNTTRICWSQNCDVYISRNATHLVIQG